MCITMFYIFLTITGGLDIDLHERLETCSAVAKEAKAQGVDPKLAISVAWMESRFYSNAKNKKSGAIGPMQILPHYWCPNKKGEFSIHKKDGVSKGCNSLKQGIYALGYYVRTRSSITKALASYGYTSKGSAYVRLTRKLHRCAKNPKRRECRRGLQK
jgi:soluble lytic murein transglycosylase-like protein